MNTCCARCRTAPRWSSPGTSRGCWPPTPATVWRGSRRPGTRRPWRPCAGRWRRRSASGSRTSRVRPFFRSTLVQTLFYGVFSAWVLWARQMPPPTGRFNWHEAVWHLRAPVLRALFQQLSDPGQLATPRPGRGSRLDRRRARTAWTRAAFFARFNEGEAVPYFYEPFLQAFDPALRKQLGVWYTPAEVVRYMVARVDRALRDDLGIADGLAAENVYVLDPCCGTGAYLAEVLRRIAANLEDRGLGALTGARVKQAALEACVWLRDHVRALRGGPPASRADHAGPGRAAGRRWGRTRRRLPHQRAHRLGAPRCRSRCRFPSWRRNATAPNK